MNFQLDFLQHRSLLTNIIIDLVTCGATIPSDRYLEINFETLSEQVQSYLTQFYTITSHSNHPIRRIALGYLSDKPMLQINGNVYTKN